MAKSTPSWVFSPREKIATILFGIVVGGFETMTGRLTGMVATIFGTVRSVYIDAGLALEKSMWYVSASLLNVQGIINEMLLNLGASTGLAAPVAVAVTVVFSFLVASLLITAVRKLVGRIVFKI